MALFLNKRDFLKSPDKNPLSIHREVTWFNFSNMLVGVGITVSCLMWADRALALTFSESSPGVFAVEAEQLQGTAGLSGDTWNIIPAGTGTYTNALGSGYIQALPDNGTVTSGPNDGPFADYNFQVETTGTYQAYIRWAGFDQASDSLYVLMPNLSSDFYQVNKAPSTDFASGTVWSGTGRKNNTTLNSGTAEAMLFNITSPSTYTFRIAMREDGAAVDSIVFQLSSLAAPTGDGPTRSAAAVPFEFSPTLGILLCGSLWGLNRLRKN